MKKQKIQSKYRNIIIALVVTIVVLAGGLVYCGVNMKSDEERERLALYEHLLNQRVEAYCDELTGNYVCAVNNNGISADGDPYVSFTADEYDAETHQPTGTSRNYTIYFQHRDSSVDGFSEAVSIEE